MWNCFKAALQGFWLAWNAEVDRQDMMKQPPRMAAKIERYDNQGLVAVLSHQTIKQIENIIVMQENPMTIELADKTGFFKITYYFLPR